MIDEKANTKMYCWFLVAPVAAIRVALDNSYSFTLKRENYPIGCASQHMSRSVCYVCTVAGKRNKKKHEYILRFDRSAQPVDDILGRPFL